MSRRTPGAWRGRARSQSLPWRAPGRRSAGSSLLGYQPGNLLHPQKSAGFYSTAPDQPSLRGTREYSARARSAPCPRLPAPPCLSSRQETRVGCGPIRPGVRVAVSGRAGPALRLAEDLESVLDAIDVVGIADPQNVPSVAQEPGGYVLREGDARVAFDGDVIVVVDPAEIVQAQVSGE